MGISVIEKLNWKLESKLYIFKKCFIQFNEIKDGCGGHLNANLRAKMPTIYKNCGRQGMQKYCRKEM